MSPAKSDVTIDNDRVRVITWTFDRAGDSTGLHRHEHDYIVIPVTGGHLNVTTLDGTIHDMTQVAGVPYPGTEGTTHTVTATSAERLTFVEVELRS